VIETPRLRLRPPRLDDATTLIALITPKISAFTATWPYPYSADMAREKLTIVLAANAQDTSFYRAITRREDDSMIGWLAMGLSTDALRTGVLSYWVGETFHGQGYLSEALPPFARAATDRLDLARITAGARPDNAASIAAMRRLGMHKTGEGMHFVPARSREELCVFYALDCSSAFSPSR
jgi:RimJ/RimL family protein N-acetyltransferase